MTKRILSLILAVLTALSLCASALASGEPAADVPAVETPAEDIPVVEEAPEDAPAEETPAEEPEAVMEPEAPVEPEATAEPEVPAEPEVEEPSDEPEEAAQNTVKLILAGETGKITVTDQDGKVVKNGSSVNMGTMLHAKLASGYAITSLSGLAAWPDAERGGYDLAINTYNGQPEAISITVGTGVKLSVTGQTGHLRDAYYSVDTVSIEALDTVAAGSEVYAVLDGDYALTAKNATVLSSRYGIIYDYSGNQQVPVIAHEYFLTAPKSGTMTVNVTKGKAAPKPISVEYDDPSGLLMRDFTPGVALPGGYLNVFTKTKAEVTAEGGKVENTTETGDGRIVYVIAVSSTAEKLVVHISDSSAKKNGIRTEGGKTYYYVDGVKQTGLKAMDGMTYYFSAKDGHMLTGVVNTGSGKLRYFSPSDGHMLKGGWIKVGGKNRYYADKDGILYTGYVTIGSKSYYFSVQDAHLMKGGIVTGPGGKQYYVSANDGHAMKGGWARGQAIKTRPGYSYYYYLDQTGAVRVTRELPTSTKIGSLATPKPSEYQN